MGRPYESELATLADTYRWAMEVPIDSLSLAIAGASDLPVLAVGSGGSFTAAAFACSLHERFTGIPSKAVTPLDFVSSRIDLRRIAMVFASAGGNNADIVNSFKNSMMREPSRCSVLCLREDSVLSRTAAKYSYVDLISPGSPPHEDGFLATNSLLSIVVLFCRGYAHAFGTDHGLPRTLTELLPIALRANGWREDLSHRCESLWTKDTLMVLFSPSLQIAAVDLESKFSEAALGTIHLADFRNFAHGRHNWLAKRGTSTAVLALVSEDDTELASKTLRLLPDDISVARFDFPATSFAATAAAGVLMAMHIVGCAGVDRRIDPGRPGVPLFGRRIYNLRAMKYVPAQMRAGCKIEDIAISRKLRCDVPALFEQPSATIHVWRNALRDFAHAFKDTAFGGILFDYDGTLCGRHQRFSGIGTDIAAVVVGLVKKGVHIGIVTGRGKSVRIDLQRHIPKSIWGRVLIGYYNGSVIGSLGDNKLPEASVTPTQAILEVDFAVRQHPLLFSLASIETRHSQLSLQPKNPGMTPRIWKIASHLAQSFPGVRAVVSGHSVDLLAPGVSKCRVLEQLHHNFPETLNVLAIGDQGEWPGNDFELLASRYSLSVDEVSADPSTCWNIAPLGYRGPQATLYYLKALTIGTRCFTLDCETLRLARCIKESRT